MGQFICSILLTLTLTLTYFFPVESVPLIVYHLDTKRYELVETTVAKLIPLPCYKGIALMGPLRLGKSALGGYIVAGKIDIFNENIHLIFLIAANNIFRVSDDNDSLDSLMTGRTGSISFLYQFMCSSYLFLSELVSASEIHLLITAS